MINTTDIDNLFIISNKGGAGDLSTETASTFFDVTSLQQLETDSFSDMVELLAPASLDLETILSSSTHQQVNYFSSSGESSEAATSTEAAAAHCSSKRKFEAQSNGFQIFFERSAVSPRAKKARTTRDQKQGDDQSMRIISSSNIDFRRESRNKYEPDTEAIAQVKEMIYRAAAMRPVNLVLEEAAAVAEKPKRKNVRISSDPQTVAARHRRERISERLRVLQKLVPGGSKMDTASMLDEAANYL